MTQHNHHRHDHQAQGEQPSHPRKGADGDVHAGHDKHAGHSVASFRDKFWLTLLLTIPTVIWSGMIQHWFDYTAPQFPGSVYIPAIFGTIVYFYGGSPFLRGGYHELRNRLPGMMTLISLARSPSPSSTARWSRSALSRDWTCGGSWRRWWRSCCLATGSRCVRSTRHRALSRS